MSELNKKEIIAKLEELKINFDPSSKKDELLELLPEDQRGGDDDGDDDEVSVVRVSVRGNIREFSQEVHGDEFEALAKDFAKKHKGEIV